ncbi:hypothetical protein ABTK62_20430, partial [Acinetobacter baumannii]
IVEHPESEITIWNTRQCQGSLLQSADLPPDRRFSVCLVDWTLPEAVSVVHDGGALLTDPTEKEFFRVITALRELFAREPITLTLQEILS